uniref:uncharacterized protein LOC123998258 isoform X2 n=1 Tax=Oncorhynchus gorbuscha TaxID=8017 RepID=UPI001EAF4E8F|nr:uncharacterized protein LOC123998258 isoform X2 [Oncorhynchus gorbuscha]
MKRNLGPAQIQGPSRHQSLRSAQVHLPEISVSSIEGLLQRVAERVGRRERDETSGLTNPDHLLMAGALRDLREKRLQHRGDYSSEGTVRCPEVKPIGGQKGTTLVTENGMQNPASLCNKTKLPIILSMSKGSL